MKYTTHIGLDYFVPATASRHSSVQTVSLVRGRIKAFACTSWTDGQITDCTIPDSLAKRYEAIKRSHERALARVRPTRIEF